MLRHAETGDDEAMLVDEDFGDRDGYGMPPSGGIGMGSTGALMALTGSGIHETIGVSAGRHNERDTTVG